MMHVEFEALFGADALTEHERARIVWVREFVEQLLDRQRDGSAIVVSGDHGGQTYFTIPANDVRLSPVELARLAFDLDSLHWSSPDAVDVTFDDPQRGGRGAGMSGHRITGGLWLHDVIEGSSLGRRVAEVLHGVRSGLWPGGSTDRGAPRRAEEMLDLLEEEDGRGPAFQLMRAVLRRSDGRPDPAFAVRAAAAMHRFLRAESPRNRIQAALALVDRAEPQVLADAVRDAVAGRIGFPPWGCWERLAATVLGDLMRRGEPAAWEAFHEFASQHGVVERYGQWLVLDWTEHDQRLTDPRILMEEIRTLRGRPRVKSIARATLHAAG